MPYKTYEELALELSALRNRAPSPKSPVELALEKLDLGNEDFLLNQNLYLIEQLTGKAWEKEKESELQYLKDFYQNGNSIN